MTTLPSSPDGSPHRWKVLWAGFVAYLFDSYDLMVLGVGESSIPGFGLGGLMRGLMAYAECPLYITRG